MSIYELLKLRGNHHLATLFINAKHDDTIPMAAADKNNIYINMEWFCTLTIRQKESILVHEALHIALQHITRGQKWGGSADAYNVAADAHINEYLPELKALDCVTHDNLPDIGMDSRKLTTEELATELEKCYTDDLPKTHDIHLTGEEHSDESKGEKRDEESSGKAQNIKQIAIEACREYLGKDNAGHIDKAFATITLTRDSATIKQSEEERLIQSLLGSAWLSPKEPSYRRPSRRNSAVNSNIILKGTAREFKKPIIDLYIDVSGSIADQAPKWVTFGKNICQKYGGQLRVSLWSDDVPEPSLTINETFQSGGTNWNELEKKLNRTRPRGHKTVIITDLQGCKDGQVKNADEVILCK